MATADDGLAAVAYAPSDVTTVVRGGTTVKVAETTDYPFRNRVELTVSPEKAAQFPLLLRVPGWATARSRPAWSISDAPIQTLELIPYAAAKLRVTAFPLIEP